MQSDMGFEIIVSRFAQPHALLDDQRPHGLLQRNGGMHHARLEACHVTALGGAPVDHPGENAPFVAGVKLHPAWLVEVVEGELAVDGGLVHCLKRRDMQGKQAGNWVCPAHSIAYFVCYSITTNKL